MSVEERADFLGELYSAAFEELSLWEVPGGSTDMQSGDVHGPWQAGDCAKVLSSWRSSGLLALYRCNADGSTGDLVSADEAAALLDRPDLWTKPDAWIEVVNLTVTEEGQATDFGAWLDLAANL
jgi:hypothetical protein